MATWKSMTKIAESKIGSCSQSHEIAKKESKSTLKCQWSAKTLTQIWMRFHIMILINTDSTFDPDELKPILDRSRIVGVNKEPDKR